MLDSTQHKLKRVRPPRVKITYDVETEGAEKLIELPLVCGVISDLSAHNTEKSSIREKDFVEVDRDNLDSYIRNVNPQLRFSVKNVLDESKKTLTVDLSFQSLEDFEIKNIIMQIKETKDLYLKMQMLKEMLIKMDGNHHLSDIVTKLAKNIDQRKNIKAQLEPNLPKKDGNNE